MRHIGCGGEVYSAGLEIPDDPTQPCLVRTQCCKCGKSIDWMTEPLGSVGQAPGQDWFAFWGEEGGGLAPPSAFPVPVEQLERRTP